MYRPYSPNQQQRLKLGSKSSANVGSTPSSQLLGTSFYASNEPQTFSSGAAGSGLGMFRPSNHSSSQLPSFAFPPPPPPSQLQSDFAQNFSHSYISSTPYKSAAHVKSHSYSNGLLADRMDAPAGSVRSVSSAATPLPYTVIPDLYNLRQPPQRQASLGSRIAAKTSGLSSLVFFAAASSHLLSEYIISARQV